MKQCTLPHTLPHLNLFNETVLTCKCSPGVHVLDGLAVDDLAARKVEQMHVGLAQLQVGGVQQVVGGVLDVGHMQRDVVRHLGKASEKVRVGGGIGSALQQTNDEQHVLQRV